MPMHNPKDTDLFMVDINYGYHYHYPGCLATCKPPGVVPPDAGYRKMFYSVIKDMKTNDGKPFEPHDCIGSLGRIRDMELGKRAIFPCNEVDHSLVEIAEDALTLAEHGNYANSNTGPDGIPDEGEVIASRVLLDIRANLDKAKSVKITYRGWPGHFCAAKDCVFRLNTLVEVGAVRVVVSTVGNLQPHIPTGSGIETVDCDHYYETMAFHATLHKGGYWDQDSGNPILVKYCVRKITVNSDQDAQEMHEAAVQEVIGRILNRKVK